MANLELKAEKRDLKSNLGDMRKKGLIPAVLYGRGVESVSLLVSEKEFNAAYKQAGESTVVDISFDGEKRPVLIHDVQSHFLKNTPIHIDFYQIKAGEKITVEVEIEFLGDSPAVKNFGGVLVKALHKIEVEALPKDLPHGLEVDLSQLKELDSSVYLKDISIPAGVKILNDLDTVVVSVVAPRQEEEKPTEETDVSKIKVEGEEKKKERDEKKEGGEK